MRFLLFFFIPSILLHGIVVTVVALVALLYYNIQQPWASMNPREFQQAVAYNELTLLLITLIVDGLLFFWLRYGPRFAQINYSIV